VNSGATIFDDRETVEFLRDHPHLLAIADAVTATQRQPSTVRRHRWPLLVAAAVAVAVVAGLSFALIPQSRHVPHGGDIAQGLTLTPDDGTFGSSVHATVYAPVGNATLQLQVLREPNEPGTEPSTEKSQVVYQERVPMTEVTKGDSAKGDNPSSTWSGSLSTSDWSGGCQKGYLYAINASAFDSSGEPAALLGGTGWRTCAG
jgi:hypothetical protein